MEPIEDELSPSLRAATATGQPGAPKKRKGHGAAVLAAFLGWTLDAFDYFLVVFCLTAIGREFHQSDARMAVSIMLTLAFRPLGALAFGLLADRYGRRGPMILNLLFYSIIEVLTGFAQSYRTFILCRALFGIGMGGQWGVGASLAMEKVPPRLRGVLSGLLQQGYALGNVLAGACYFFLFPRFGWRPLFFLGGLPALLALFVRFGVEESEVWKQTRHQSWTDIGSSVVSYWRLFVYLTIFMMSMNFASHGTQDMYPTFLERQWHLSPEKRSAITAFSMIGAIIGGISFGYLSDHWGRRKAMILAFGIAILTIPVWAYAPSLALLVAGAFVMQVLVQGAWGVVPAHLSELSPDSVRGFLPGFAYQCGVLLASSVVYIEAMLAQRLSYAHAMAITAAIVFSFAAVVAFLGQERKGAVFGKISSGAASLRR